MSLSKRFGPYALKLHAKTAQSGGAVYVDGVQEQELNSELQDLLEGGDDSVYNTFGALLSGAPALRVTTNDLKALLDAAGLTGMLIDADGSHPGVVAYWQKGQKGAARASGGAHLSATLPNGILVPRSIELPHRGSAVVQAEAILWQEGATAPVGFDEAASLPAIYPEVAALWTLGPWKVGANAIEGIQQVSIDTGIQVVTDAGDSDVYPTYAYIERTQPSIRITARHIDVTSFVTEDGVYSASGVVGYAKKRAEGSSFVADGTAEHIKFTMGKCRVSWEGIGGKPAQVTLRLTPWYTAGVSPVLPITINTASAIT